MKFSNSHCYTLQPCADMIRRSAGILSPPFTSTRSPTTTPSAFMLIFSPFLTTRACWKTVKKQPMSQTTLKVFKRSNYSSIVVLRRFLLILTCLSQIHLRFKSYFCFLDTKIPCCCQGDSKMVRCDTDCPWKNLSFSACLCHQLHMLINWCNSQDAWIGLGLLAQLLWV